MGFVCLFLFLFCLFFKLFFNPRVISHYCNNTILQAGIWPIVEQHTKLIQITLCSCFIIYRACLTFPTGPRQYSLQLGDQFKGSSRGRASCVVEAFIQDLRGKFLFFPLQTHDSSNWSNFKNFDCKKKGGMFLPFAMLFAEIEIFSQNLLSESTVVVFYFPLSWLRLNLPYTLCRKQWKPKCNWWTNMNQAPQGLCTLGVILTQDNVRTSFFFFANLKHFQKRIHTYLFVEGHKLVCASRQHSISILTNTELSHIRILTFAAVRAPRPRARPVTAPLCNPKRHRKATKPATIIKSPSRNARSGNLCPAATPLL